MKVDMNVFHNVCIKKVLIIFTSESYFFLLTILWLNNKEYVF